MAAIPSPRRSFVVAVLLGWLVASPGSGQTIPSFNPSISSLGMGQAGAALFWENDRSDWANPALLGYESGARYSHGHVSASTLMPDAYLEFDRMALGAWGAGLSIVGKPISGLGGYRIDYGLSEATNQNGDVIGTFRSYQDVRQIGVGISLVQLYGSLRRHFGHEPPSWNRYVDLSLGHSWKKTVFDLIPSSFINQGGRGEANERDRGALLRVTPIGGGGGDEPGPRKAAGLRLDTAAAFSQRNYAESSIGYADVDALSLGTEERLVAVAGRLSASFATSPSPIWDVLTPGIAMSGTWEQARYYKGGTRVYGDTINRTGQELDLFGFLFVRHGNVGDPALFDFRSTWGFGGRIQYRGIAGVQYDWAQVPAYGYPDNHLERQAVTLTFDPLRLVHANADENPVEQP